MYLSTSRIATYLLRLSWHSGQLQVFDRIWTVSVVDCSCSFSSSIITWRHRPWRSWRVWMPGYCGPELLRSCSCWCCGRFSRLGSLQWRSQNHGDIRSHHERGCLSLQSWTVQPPRERQACRCRSFGYLVNYIRFSHIVLNLISFVNTKLLKIGQLSLTLHVGNGFSWAIP